MRVAVENADRFHLDLAGSWSATRQELDVSRQRRGRLEVTPAAGRSTSRRTAGKWSVAADRYPRRLVKKHGLSGPIQDVFMGDPVLMVYGTPSRDQNAGKAEDDRRRRVQRLFGPGDGGGVLHTAFERKADSDVSADDIAEKNLVLFGTPQQNLLEKIADKLPVSSSTTASRSAASRSAAPDVGLVMVYPNPLNPERYVLLLPENYCGGCPFNFPTTSSARRRRAPRAAQQILAQGAFDAKWQMPR